MEKAAGRGEDHSDDEDEEKKREVGDSIRVSWSPSEVLLRLVAITLGRAVVALLHSHADGETERGAPVLLAVHPHRAAHHLAQAHRYGQPQPAALVFPVRSERMMISEQ